MVNKSRILDAYYRFNLAEGFDQAVETYNETQSAMDDFNNEIVRREAGFFDALQPGDKIYAAVVYPSVYWGFFEGACGYFEITLENVESILKKSCNIVYLNLDLPKSPIFNSSVRIPRNISTLKVVYGTNGSVVYDDSKISFQTLNPNYDYEGIDLGRFWMTSAIFETGYNGLCLCFAGTPEYLRTCIMKLMEQDLGIIQGWYEKMQNEFTVWTD